MRDGPPWGSGAMSSYVLQDPLMGQGGSEVSDDLAPAGDFPKLLASLGARPIPRSALIWAGAPSCLGLGTERVLAGSPPHLTCL